MSLMRLAFLTGVVLIVLGNVRFAQAVAVNEVKLHEFIEKSRAEPHRVHVLKVSTTWCDACKELAASLSKYPSKGDSISRAYWSSVNQDELPAGAWKSFCRELGIPQLESWPNSIAFKNGKPIGTIVGADLKELRTFLSDVEAVDPSTVRHGPPKSKLIPKMPCGPKEPGAACVVGISGSGSPEDQMTDDFGRVNLKSFAQIFDSPEFSRLLGPEVPKLAAVAHEKSAYAVFYVKNPFQDDQEDFGSLDQAEHLLKSLPELPGDNVRILFTGHGGQQGVITGFKGTDEDAANGTYTTSYLPHSTVTEAVQGAVSKGKVVRAVVVQCYGGGYGASFMPSEGSAGRACAAFATLPSLLSEGCYPATFGMARNDYMAEAARQKTCDGKQNARDLHYAIAAHGKSHDVPMLSSEYFLLYGPASTAMLKREPLTLPREMVVKKQSDKGVTVYFDALKNTLLSGSVNGVPLRTAGMSSSMGAGRYAYQIDWKAEDETSITGDSVSFEPSKEKLQPITKDDPVDPRISAEFSSIMPDTGEGVLFLYGNTLRWLFAQPNLRASIEDTVDAIAKHDPPLADAIKSLAGKVKDNTTMVSIVRAAFDNVFGNETSDEDEQKALQIMQLRRLAHLLSAAVAELDLRQKASAGDPQAQKLLAQLEQLKACETDLL